MVVMESEHIPINQMQRIASLSAELEHTAEILFFVLKSVGQVIMQYRLKVRMKIPHCLFIIC